MPEEYCDGSCEPVAMYSAPQRRMAAAGDAHPRGGWRRSPRLRMMNRRRDAAIASLGEAAVVA